MGYQPDDFTGGQVFTCMYHGFQLITELILTVDCMHIGAGFVQKSFQVGVNITSMIHQGFKSEF